MPRNAHARGPHAPASRAQAASQARVHAHDPEHPRRRPRARGARQCRRDLWTRQRAAVSTHPADRSYTDSRIGVHKRTRALAYNVLSGQIRARLQQSRDCGVVTMICSSVQGCTQILQGQHTPLHAVDAHRHAETNISLCINCSAGEHKHRDGALVTPRRGAVERRQTVLWTHQNNYRCAFAPCARPRVRGRTQFLASTTALASRSTVMVLSCPSHAAPCSGRALRLAEHGR